MSWCNDWERNNCDCDRDRDRDKDHCCKKIIIKKECCDRDRDRDRPRCCERRRRFCFCGIFRCGGRRHCGDNRDGCGCGCGCGW